MRLRAAIDLTDPQQNLLIGSTHLRRLYDRLEGAMVKSLMAYNAGLSRVRDWDERFAQLPLDIYVEAVPFAETRGYVRKILVSSVYYGWLYNDNSVGETLRTFFPAERASS